MNAADDPLAMPSLGLMTKFWEPGRVKTRLGRELGMARAAAIHREFLDFLTTQLTDSTIPPAAIPPSTASTLDPGNDPSRPYPAIDSLRRTVVYTPTDRGGEFSAALASSGGDWACEPQCDGDLGRRMSHWLRATLRSTNLAILIGCDCPLLSRANIAESLEKLRTADVVLGPALDGGYYLVGLAGPYQSWHDRLFFEMPWSTSSVLETTLARISEAGASVAQLTPRNDIDELADLQSLLEQLAVSDSVLRRALGNRLKKILGTSDARLFR